MCGVTSRRVEWIVVRGGLGEIGRWMGVGPAFYAISDIQIIVDLERDMIPAFRAVCGAETELVVNLLLLSGVSCSDRLEFTLMLGIREEKKCNLGYL